MGVCEQENACYEQKDEEPLISVIVPVYNVEDYIKRCINSIINQKYKNIEIILIDDGSPDNCGAICNDYALKDNRIKVIHKRNGGQSSARNAGLDVASGKYIGFVDSDDWVDGDMFEVLVTAAEKENADIVQCGFKAVLNDGTVKRRYSFTNDSYIDSDAVMSAYFSQTKIDVVMWNKLYVKSLFNDIRMVEGRLYEDTMVSCEILLKTKKFVSIDGMYYNYLQRDTSTIGAPFSPRKLDAIFAGRYVLILCEKNGSRYVNYARLLLCLYCFYLYNNLILSNERTLEQYKEIIIDEFILNYEALKRSKELRQARKKTKILIKTFAFNKSLAIIIYRLYCRIRKSE